MITLKYPRSQPNDLHKHGLVHLHRFESIVSLESFPASAVFLSVLYVYEMQYM